MRMIDLDVGKIYLSNEEFSVFKKIRDKIPLSERETYIAQILLVKGVILKSKAGTYIINVKQQS